MVDLTEKLLTTNTIRLVTIVGEYLLLGPHLQRLPGDLSPSDYHRYAADRHMHARLPKVRPSDSAAGRRDDDSGIGPQSIDRRCECHEESPRECRSRPKHIMQGALGVYITAGRTSTWWVLF